MNNTELTSKEIKTFTNNCNELIDYVKTYGLPLESSILIPEFQLACRMRSIKNRPELLIIAKKLDTNRIVFK